MLLVSSADSHTKKTRNDHWNLFQTASLCLGLYTANEGLVGASTLQEMSGSDLCIPRNETLAPRYFHNRIIMFYLWEYINRSQMYMNAVSFLGIYVSSFLYSVPPFLWFIDLRFFFGMIS